MERVRFRGQLADAYPAARRLPAASIDVWMRIAATHLPPDAAPILDLGAGTGRFSYPLARQFGDTVIAMEPSADMRRLASRDCPPPVRVVGGQAEAIPCAGNTFRAVWMSQVIHHVSDVDRCAAELRRVLRPGGVLLLRGGFHDVDRVPPLHRYFSALRRLASEGSSALAAMRAALATVGLHEHAHDIVAQESASSLRELYRQATLRGRSPLQRLTDAEFADGLARLRTAADLESSATPVIDHVDLITFT